MKIRESGMPVEEIWGQFFNVPDILLKMEINKSISSLVEIGCGYGTFTIETAKKVKGQVHAFDIDPVMIEITYNKTKQQNIRNVNLILSDIISAGTGFAENSTDYVMLFNILHHSNPVEMLTEIYRILKPEGKVGVIHWRSDIVTPRGPDLKIRPNPEQIIEWSKKSGYDIYKKSFILEPFHFGMIIRKPLKK